MSLEAFTALAMSVSLLLQQVKSLCPAVDQEEEKHEEASYAMSDKGESGPNIIGNQPPRFDFGHSTPKQ